MTEKQNSDEHVVTFRDSAVTAGATSVEPPSGAPAPAADPSAPLPVAKAAASSPEHSASQQLPSSAAANPIPLESLHAYLMLEDEWALPRSGQQGSLEYSRWRRDGAGTLTLPLHQPAGGKDIVPALIAEIATLEGRSEKDLEVDLGRLRSMRALRSGPFAALREGKVDPDFNKTIRTIIMQTATFIVYLDEKDDVIWNTSDDYDSFPGDFGKAMNRLSALEAEPIQHLAAAVRHSFRSLLADGVARLLDEHAVDNAMAVFDRAETYLANRSNEAARFVYLVWGSVPTLLSIVAAVVLWLYRTELDHAFVPGFTVAAVSGCMGGVGAFLSIFLRITAVDLDARAGKRLLAVECVLRIFVGVAAATAVGWAINANLLLGFTATLAGGWIGTKMLLGLLAGSSERVMPTLMKKFDDMADQEGTGDAANRAAPPAPPVTAPTPQATTAVENAAAKAKPNVTATVTSAPAPKA